MISARVHHYKRISTPLSEQIVVSAEEIWIDIQKNVFPREQQPSCIGEIRNDQVSSFNILPAPKWKKVLRPLYLKFRQGKHNHLVNLDMISPRADLLRQTEKDGSRLQTCLNAETKITIILLSEYVQHFDRRIGTQKFLFRSRPTHAWEK